ncbi:MAG: hypothetical protein UW18_C0017G0014 [Microgenomates group bacterium GW2011_GWF1_44_10]|nr:MAG: hypothetical protein UW18_C0017G0014 [Microgenomates group bacterium GW2011_GWF1_44_10]
MFVMSVAQSGMRKPINKYHRKEKPNMKVRELIKQLRYIDPENEVFLGEIEAKRTGKMKKVYGDITIRFHNMVQFGPIDSVILTGQYGSELHIAKRND